jgi:hypothetical protein
MNLLFVLVGCVTSGARDRARSETAVIEARAALEAASRSTVPGCAAVSAQFRTEWADLPRSLPGAPNVHALRTDDGRLVVRILVRDGHGDAFAHVFSEPPADRTVLAALFERCGLGEWETYDDLGDGWFAVASGLD